MTVERIGASQIDLIDTVLDKGIVVDAWACVSVAGIDLINPESRIVVALIETHLDHSRNLHRGDHPPSDRTGTTRPTASDVAK
jgi:hypothetical protein